MNRISDEQIRRNQMSRQGWELYRQHRERITQLLIGSSRSTDATLCVLGAGNCNDLDLQRLRASFRAIRLVDLDSAALLSGCEFQGVADDPAIQRSGGVDVTGVAQRVEAWHPDSPVLAEQVQTVIEEALAASPAGLDAESFDVVASAGLLTQLIDTIDLTLGPRHPQFAALMSAVRIRHLRLLLELTRPGGKAWLFSEVVSSVTCPELLQTPVVALVPVLQRAIAQQNFFTGANPAILHRLFLQDPQLHACVSSLETPPPWLWNFFTRTYAVCAVGANKK